MYTFVIGAFFKNESQIIKEWIEHYFHHGVDHIYLINDHSTDNYLEILQPYIDSKMLTLYHATDETSENRQMFFYNKYFQKHLNSTKWFGIFDLDEFLYSTKQINLKLELEIYKQYDQILINWVHFGSSHHKNQPYNVVSNFLYRSEYNSVKNGPNGRYNSYKSIVKVSDKPITFGIHKHASDNTLKEIHVDFNDNSFLINHYVIQSKEFWETIKMTRGSATSYYKNMGWERDKQLFIDCDVNDVFDERLSIQNNYSKKFDNVISLGMRCLTYSFLKKIDVKVTKYILDSAFSKSINDIIYLLQNGIKDDELIYTETEHRFKEINNNGFRTIHSRFNNEPDVPSEYHRATFPHCNFNNLEEKEKMRNKIAFLDIIKETNSRILFVMFVLPKYVGHCQPDNNPSDEEIKKLSSFLQTQFNCHLLTIKFQYSPGETRNFNKWFFLKREETNTIAVINTDNYDYADSEDSFRKIISFFNVPFIN